MSAESWFRGKAVTVPAVADPFRPATVRLPEARTRSERIEAFDASRGLAMVLVCLSHFIAVTFRKEYSAGQHLLPVEIAMVASPTFVAVSGIMLGLLSSLNRAGFARLRIKLIDRALFLLTIAHLLIALSRVPYEVRHADALRMMFLTDAVSASLLMGVWIVPNTSRLFRLLLGALSFTGGWALILFWRPSTDGLLLFKEIVAGASRYRMLSYGVPILPWFGVYLACSVLGQHLASKYRVRDRAGVERLLMTVALGALAAALSLRVLGWVLRPPGAGASWRFEPLFSPWSKVPPGPVYVLFFGSLGLGLIGLMAIANHRGWIRGISRLASMLGRCSLAVFTVQFYLYYTILGSLHLTPGRGWPLLFALTLLPLLFFARWWDRHDLNSVLSVGLQAALRQAHPAGSHDGAMAPPPAVPDSQERRAT